MKHHYPVGLDFGTESVRAIVVDVANGELVGQASCAYSNGVIDTVLPGTDVRLPPEYALQSPTDWLDGASVAGREAMRGAGVSLQDVIGVGVDFTSCTMLPALRDGTPLCYVPGFERVPLAWPKLWKHHAAKAATQRINQVARERAEAWLARYGGIVGLEWLFPKILETLTDAPAVYDATEVWLEAGDWFVWQLTSGPFPACRADDLVRSTCQAGYKGLWSAETGYPSREFLSAVDPQLADVVTTKMPGRFLPPGCRAGVLTRASAERLGLAPGTPVSAAIIDAHAGVPGSGATGPDTLVLVMGTSSCHMINSVVGHEIPGVAGVVRDGILPGYFGYETGQAAVGDAFAWVARLTGKSHAELNSQAALLSPGSGGVLAIDWLNGCRTPLMDGSLTGTLFGLRLGTQPAQIYRAMMEATAFGLRTIVNLLRDGGVPITRFVASGGLPARSPLLMQIYADVLNADIELAGTDQSVALGAAILGVLASRPITVQAEEMEQIIKAMTPRRDDKSYHPNPHNAVTYQKLYDQYHSLTRAASIACSVPGPTTVD